MSLYNRRHRGNLSRVRDNLPNGYCGRPPQQECPHSTTCLTCPDFQTTPEFLDVHREQAGANRIAHADDAGHFRLAANPPSGPDQPRPHRPGPGSHLALSRAAATLGHPALPQRRSHAGKATGAGRATRLSRVATAKDRGAQRRTPVVSSGQRPPPRPARTVARGATLGDGNQTIEWQRSRP
jgi:hypothetical protein